MDRPDGAPLYVRRGTGRQIGNDFRFDDRHKCAYLLAAAAKKPSRPPEIIENVIALNRDGRKIRLVDVEHAIRASEPITITQHPALRSWPTPAAPAETPPLTGEDFYKMNIRNVANEIKRNMRSNAEALTRYDAGDIIETWADAEYDRFRADLAFVDKRLRRP